LGIGDHVTGIFDHRGQSAADLSAPSAVRAPDQQSGLL
jgi:hypothetical protein